MSKLACCRIAFEVYADSRAIIFLHRHSLGTGYKLADHIGRAPCHHATAQFAGRDRRQQFGRRSLCGIERRQQHFIWLFRRCIRRQRVGLRLDQRGQRRECRSRRHALTRPPGTNTTAVGNSSNASGNNGVSFGVSSAASALNSTALGTQAVASGTNSVAIGRGSIATVADTVSFGITGGERRLTNVAAGINPTDGVNVSQLTALDTSVDTRINNAFNTFANFQGTGGVSSVAIGDHAIASGPSYHRHRGRMPRRQEPMRLLLGTGATAANAVAVGTGANAADNGAAFGNLASATGTNSTALGPAATASGPNAAALGSGSSATGSGAVALGPASTASGLNSAALGNGSSATGTNAVALGPNAVASAPNSAAIGSGSIANQANTVSVGSVGNERQRRRGSASTDAVNVQQFQAGMSGFNSQIAATNARIDTVDQQARRGIAATAAMAPTMMPSQIGRTTVALSTGFYRGEAALSVSVARRLNVAAPTVVFGSYANGGGSEHVGRVGVATEF